MNQRTIIKGNNNYKSMTKRKSKTFGKSPIRQLYLEEKIKEGIEIIEEWLRLFNKKPEYKELSLAMASIILIDVKNYLKELKQ